MKVFPQRFFDPATNENGGAATLEKVESGEQGGGNGQPNEPTKEVAAGVISDEDLKTMGFDSKEALISFLKKTKEENISPEEKKAKEDLAKADFLKYSTEKKLLNVDEYNQYETLKSKADKDLVFENYLSVYKEEHPEITDELELKEAAEEDFEYEYKLHSKNEATKKRYESKLARDAKELRSPIETKVLSAQEAYEKETSNYKAIEAAYPKFEKFVNEVIQKNTPDKKAITQIKIGDEEVNVEIELTQADRDAIAKTFKTPKTFQSFTSGKPDEIQASLDKKIEGWILANKKQEIINKAVELASGVAIKNGSNVGATNPFGLKQGAPAENTGEETLEESNARMAARTQKYRNR